MQRGLNAVYGILGGILLCIPITASGYVSMAINSDKAEMVILCGYNDTIKNTTILKMGPTYSFYSTYSVFVRT